MAKGERRSGRRRARTVITPLRIAKAAVVVDGALRVLPSSWGGKADYTTLGWQYDHNGIQGVLKAPFNDKQAQAKLVPVLWGVAEIAVGPKLLDKGVAFVSKGEPTIGKIARTKLATI